jgi:hypothetical protein
MDRHETRRVFAKPKVTPPLFDPSHQAPTPSYVRRATIRQATEPVKLTAEARETTTARGWHLDPKIHDLMQAAISTSPRLGPNWVTAARMSVFGCD